MARSKATRYINPNYIDSFDRGDRIGLNDINQLVADRLSSIVGGFGISVMHVGDRVVIENTHPNITKDFLFSGSTKSTLPTNVAYGSFGLTTGNNIKRSYVFLDAATSSSTGSWLCFSHLEATS